MTSTRNLRKIYIVPNAASNTVKQNNGVAPNVLHLISPTGFYGAERWILALASQMGGERGRCEFAITSENPEQNFEVYERYPASAGSKYRLEMTGRFDFSIVKRLASLISDQQIDIVHTHGYKSDIIGYLAARRADIACVSTPHGFGYDIDIKLRLFIRIGGYFLRRFNRVVPLSEELADEVRKMGVKESQIRLIENAADFDEIDAVVASSKSANSSSVRRIGYVGQLISRKQIDQLINVFARLCENEPNLELIIAGEGDQRTALENQASTLECRDKIKFLGYVEDRLTLMQSFDMFVMTSASEGIPRSMMEALAMSLPTVAYDIPGVDVLIDHGVTGLLATLNDQVALEANMASLISDPNKAKQLGAEARKHVEYRFSAGRMALEYYDLYKDLLGELNA